MFSRACIVNFGDERLVWKNAALAQVGIHSIQYHRYSQPDHAFRRLPLPWATVVITLGTASRWRRGSQEWHTFPRIAVRGHGGTWSEGKDQGTSACEYLTALIEPWAFEALTQISAREVAGRVLDVAGTGAIGQRLDFEKISRAPDGLTKMRLFAQAFRPTRYLSCDPRVVHFSRLCRVSAGNLRVAGAVECMGISERQFRTVFSESFGSSPKAWARLERFSAYLHELQSGEGAHGSHVGGPDYYDQSHAIREFQAFAGATPGQYAREKAQTSDKRLFLMSARPATTD